MGKLKRIEDGGDAETRRHGDAGMRMENIGREARGWRIEDGGWRGHRTSNIEWGMNCKEAQRGQAANQSE